MALIKKTIIVVLTTVTVLAILYICIFVILIAGVSSMIHVGPPPSSMYLTPPAVNAALTMDMYNQILTGMAYKQVVKITGWEGTEVERQIGSQITVTYIWNNEKSNMKLKFTDDRLIEKMQVGIK